MATPKNHAAKYRAIIAKNQYHRTHYPLQSSTSPNLHGHTLYHESNQNTSFVQLLGPLMLQLGQHMPFEEKIDLELYDGKREGAKNINKELLGQDMHILYQAMADDKERLTHLFEKGLSKGKTPENVAEELVKKFDLRTKVKSIPSTPSISYPLPSDLNFHALFHDDMPAHEGSDLSKLLESNEAQQFYTQPMNTFSVLGEDYDKQHQRYLKQINLASTMAPDPFGHNDVKVIEVHDNFHDMIEKEGHLNLNPNQFLALITEQRQQSKQLEKALRFFFGSHQNAINAENINENEALTNLTTPQLSQHINLIKEDLQKILNTPNPTDILKTLQGFKESIASLNTQKNQSLSTQNDLIFVKNLVSKIERQFDVKNAYYAQAQNKKDLSSTSPLEILNDRWGKIDFSQVNPHAFSMMNAFLTNPHLLGYQFYDETYNKSLTKSSLESFKEQALLKSLYAIKKNIDHDYQPTYKIHTQSLHDGQTQEGAERFSRLVELGLITTEGDIKPRYKQLSKADLQKEFNVLKLDTKSISALMTACLPNTRIDLDYIDEGSLRNIQLETPQGDSLSLNDVYMLINKGHDVDEKYENTLQAYGIFLDMFKSMTHFHELSHEDYSGKAIITKSGDAYQMDVYRNATWQESDQADVIAPQQSSLTLKSMSKEKLEALYQEIQKILVQLEPIVRVGFDKETRLLSHNKYHGISSGPVQVLYDNQGQWDFENNRVIARGDENYKLGIDRLLTPDYFDMDVHNEARESYREKYTEVTLANSLKLQLYNDINSREEENKQKESKEKTEKELKEEKARDKEDFKSEVREEQSQRANLNRRRNERNKQFKEDLARRRADRNAENKRLSKRNSISSKKRKR